MSLTFVEFDPVQAKKDRDRTSTKKKTISFTFRQQN